MNRTKWEELRLSILGLDNLHPRWRTKDLSGYVSAWDREWFYRFHVGGYETIEWVEIQVESPEQNTALQSILSQIHVPGHRIEGGFRVYGYVDDGMVVDYI